MKTYEITSSQNETYKLLQSLLTSQGIKRHQQALIFGKKPIFDVVKRHSSHCLGVIFTQAILEENAAILSQLGLQNMTQYILKSDLFDYLDIFGSNGPILLTRIPEMLSWDSQKEVPGCQLLLPLQEPSNVGAALRSAAAFGVKNVILSQGAAHPFHPKSSRAASGTLWDFKYYTCDELSKMSFGDQKVVALDMKGEGISKFRFPSSFILLPGLEGSGLPKNLKVDFRVKIPMTDHVESLNAVVATSIALHRWSTP